VFLEGQPRLITRGRGPRRGPNPGRGSSVPKILGPTRAHTAWETATTFCAVIELEKKTRKIFYRVDLVCLRPWTKTSVTRLLTRDLSAAANLVNRETGSWTGIDWRAVGWKGTGLAPGRQTTSIDLSLSRSSRLTASSARRRRRVRPPVRLRASVRLASGDRLSSQLSTFISSRGAVGVDGGLERVILDTTADGHGTKRERTTTDPIVSDPVLLFARQTNNRGWKPGKLRGIIWSDIGPVGHRCGECDVSFQFYKS